MMSDEGSAVVGYVVMALTGLLISKGIITEAELDETILEMLKLTEVTNADPKP